MTDLLSTAPPPWSGALLAAVDEAFAVTGAETPGWADPHPDRDPLEEEYSRVTDQSKYRILGSRVDAWVRVLADAGLAAARDVPSETWVGQLRSPADHSRVRRLDPTHPDGLSVLLASTLVDGAPFGLEVGVVRGTQTPVLLAPLPRCGCDACDSGSADLLDELDGWVLTVIRGGVVHAQRGPDSATRMIDGWCTSGGAQESWLEESASVPNGVERWVGACWVAGVALEADPGLRTS